MSSILEDATFQNELIALLIRDRVFLRNHIERLTVQDFEPNIPDSPHERWYLAGICLDFYREHKEPVDRLLKMEVQRFIRTRSLHEKAATRLTTYAERLLKLRPSPIKPIEDRLVEFKMMNSMVRKLNDLASMLRDDEVTPEKWNALALMEENGSGDGIHVVDYLPGLEDRITRRKDIVSHRQYPWLLIPGFDESSRSIPRSHLGLIMAPYGRGKGLMFSWLDMAYSVQGWNVMHVTLEDPVNDVEDRLDASLTRLPIKVLANPLYERTLRGRYTQYMLPLLKSRIHIVDGTDGGMTISQIEEEYNKLRDQGSAPDVILIDYDEYLLPVQKKQQKRYEEFNEIYKDFKRLLARTETIGWIASQTGRGTEKLKVIQGDEVEGDIGKPRKATLVVSLGMGDWGDESIYFWIEKNRLDRPHRGFNIMPNKAMMLFYDHQRTLEELAKEKHERSVESR